MSYRLGRPAYRHGLYRLRWWYFEIALEQA